MKSRLVVLLLAVVALVATGCSGHDAVDQMAGGQYRFVSATTPGKTWKPADRKRAGDFTAEYLDGKGTFDLSDDAGKVVVVNYWASWCAPCQTETPQFDLVYRDYKSRGVDFVGVDFKDERDKAQAFVHDNDISYPMVYDRIGKTALELGNIPALGLPFTVLIDRRGRVAAVYNTAVQPKDLERGLNRLLAEPTPVAAGTARPNGSGA